MLEGTEALVFHPKHPRTVKLPETPASGSLRQARVRLRLDEEGRFSGDVSLVLTGHHVRVFQSWQELDVLPTWRAWLADRLDGFKSDAQEVVLVLE